MAKRMTKAQKVEAAAKAAAEGAAANTATEPTTTAEAKTGETDAKVGKSEVIGTLEALISAFGSADAALEACESKAMQRCVAIFEAGEEGDRGHFLSWDGTKVLAVGGKWLLFGKKAFKEYCEFLENKKAQFTPFGELESALKAFKDRAEKKAQFEADRAKRIAAYAEMCLTDGSTWSNLDDMIEGNLPEIIAAMTPHVGEKHGVMADQLKIAGGTIGELEADLTTALAAVGEIKGFEDYRAVLDAVKAEWKQAGKVCSYVASMSLMIVSRGARGRFGMLVMTPDTKVFVAEFERQWAAEQTAKRVRFESNQRNEGKKFEEWTAPRIMVVDPAFGLLNHKLFFRPSNDAYAAKKAAEDAAAAEKRAAAEKIAAAERERRNQTLTFNLGKLLAAATESDLDDIVGAGKGRRGGRREKGDRRHNRI